MDTRIERYIHKQPESQQQIIRELHSIILHAVKDVQEGLKWSMPVYEKNGMLVYIEATKKCVKLGFAKGTLLRDPKGLLLGTGQRMRHIKIYTFAELRRFPLVTWLKQAVKLNGASPSRR